MEENNPMEHSAMQEMANPETRRDEGEKMNNMDQRKNSMHNPQKMKFKKRKIGAMDKFPSQLPHISDQAKRKRQILNWPDKYWEEIDHLVLRVFKKSSIVLKAIPFKALHGTKDSTYRLNQINLDDGFFSIPDEDVTSFCEIQGRLRLTQIQAKTETEFQTFKTMLVGCASSMAFGFDSCVLNGTTVARTLQPFGGTGSPTLQILRGEITQGLVPNLLPDPISVAPINVGTTDWGLNFYDGVATAFARLQGGTGQGGQITYPNLFTCIVPPVQYGNAHQVLDAQRPGTPADSIRALMDSGFYSTSAMPANTGLIISKSGHQSYTVLGNLPEVRFSTENEDNDFLFTLSMKFLLIQQRDDDKQFLQFT